MLLQGERMKAAVGNGIVLPAAALNFVKMLVITLLIPVLDRAIYPLLGQIGHWPTLLQRIGQPVRICVDAKSDDIYCPTMQSSVLWNSVVVIGSRE